MHKTLSRVATWDRWAARALALIFIAGASFWTATEATAQYAYPIDHSEVVHSEGMIISPGPPPEKVCRLHPQDYAAEMPQTIRALQQAPGEIRAARAQFETTYEDACGGESWPEEAIEDFERALDIWATHVESSVPIRIEATWAELGEDDNGSTLGTAGPTRVVRFQQDDRSIGMRADTWYPVAAASALSGQDIVGEQIDEEDYDVVVNMNCDYENWHFGEESPPTHLIDFTTIVLHEVGHGLGFLGLMQVPVDEDQEVVEEIATWGLEPQEGEDPLPIVYDRFAIDGQDRSLLNEDVYPNPSEELYEALTGEYGGVFFEGPSASAAEDNDAPELYTPEEWRAGSSYSHVDQRRYTNTLDALMRPFADRGLRIETPGPITCGIMSDIGWPVGSDCRAFFTPALADLHARVENAVVELSWEPVDGVESYNVEYLALNEPDVQSYTLAETNVQAPFEVSFADLSPGEYLFRVSPTDARARSDEVLAFVGIEDPVFVRGPYPNPFTDRAEVLFVVDQEQHIELSVYDAAGRRVAVLYDERAEPNEVYQRSLNDVSLSSGVYLFHFVGETFERTETGVLVR